MLRPFARTTRLFTVAASILGSGCFPSSTFSPPSPEERERLVLLAEADPTDVESVARLAVTQLLDGDPDGARTLLEPTATAVPSDPEIPVLLALANEGAGRFTDAAALYETYVWQHIGPLAAVTRARLEAARPEVFQDEVRRRQSDDPGTRPPIDPRSILLMPLAHPAGDGDAAAAISTIVPILVALDLEGRGVRPVDPQRTRILLDGMDVEPDGLSDPPLGSRLGRELGAGVVVQGAPSGIGTAGMSIDLTFWRLGGDQPDSMTHVVLTDLSLPGQTARRISTMVMQLLEGRPQSTAFLEALPAADWSAAILAGRAARALDAGDAVAARDLATEALAVDPDFHVATDLLARAELVERADAMTWREAALEAARLGGLQRAVMTVRGDPASAQQSAFSDVGRADRILASDLLGLDRIVPGTLVEVTLGEAP